MKRRVSAGLAWALLAGAAAVSTTVPASAADVVYAPPPPAVILPDVYEPRQAVSALNGKLEAGYSWLSYDGFVTPFTGDKVHTHNIYGIGSVSAPVSRQFGVQVDAGILGSIAGRTMTGGVNAPFEVNPRNSAYGIAGHAFWRDPDVALLGVYAHYVRFQQDYSSGFVGVDGNVVANTFRVGAAGEYYYNNWTLEGFAGADFVHTRADFVGPGVTEENRTFFAGRAIAAYYPNDDTRVFAGVEYAFNEFAGLVGGEYLFNSASPIATAAFIEGSLGQSATTIEAGVRVYFGPTGKSLIARHREDDPRAQLFDAIGALGSCAGSIVSEHSGNNIEAISARAVESPTNGDGFVDFDGGSCGNGGMIYLDEPRREKPDRGSEDDR